MDVFQPLLQGFAAALTPQNLCFGFIGCVLGTLVGVLPGIGPTSAIAMLLPLTLILDPTPAIIMLSGIYYGAMYGGSTTAILVNIPGEISSAPTALDGYAMAKKGRAGPALAISAISSFVAGTLSLVGLTFFAPTLAQLALHFGPPEYFALMLLALSVVINLSGKSLIKGLISAVAGFFVAMVGMDPITGIARFTFGSVELMSGIDFVSVIIGLFAIAEVLSTWEAQVTPVIRTKLTGLMPTREDLRETFPAMLRSTVIGFFLGLLPGCSPGVTAFIAYDTEKRFSRVPETFGQGQIAGVAAAEGANNATTSGGFVPLLSFGIPSGPALAVLLGGFMMYGLQPGPTLFEKNAPFVWALIASMYIGNVMLIILNLPLVGLWARLVKVPYPLLAPIILISSFIGAYSVRNKMMDVWLAIAFGLIGWLMRKLEIPSVPLILTTILAGMLETSIKQTLSMGDMGIYLLFTRPISLTICILALLLTISSLYGRYKKIPLPGDAEEFSSESFEFPDVIEKKRPVLVKPRRYLHVPKTVYLVREHDRSRNVAKCGSLRMRQAGEQVQR
ncbi:tripartite tricarboxylate transporter permease [Heliobacillus mobilis]|uniref:Tripartite tricarboxylate transporter permease n=1 Tax=Heliobacterium mobile TaxID=28064 RepID=A0A6I3SHH3_HELMO|nr:tripartite tricarboxylate transporter permease [Heliobacterium mobile]MTV48276.1 tripartite tricarboxylate transporter permease [Heliobacterium mobile]